MKTIILAIMLTAFAFTAFAEVNVGVDVTSPNVSIKINTEQQNAQPVQPVKVIEKEKIIIIEKDKKHHDNGKHKGQYK